MTRFAILAAPRTGSNLLCTLLNSHPHVLCHHEVFNPRGVFTAHDYRGATLKVDSLVQRDEDPIAFLARVWRTGSRDGGVGFKWTRGQSEKVLKHVVHDSDVKKIVLRRRNRIKTFVSEKIAQKTSQWEVYDRRELMLPRPRIDVSDRELLAHVESNQRFYDQLSSDLSRTGQPHHQLYYEDLFDGQVQTGLFEFLQVPQPQFRPVAGSVKQNPSDLRETVANFDELADRLSGSLLTELFDQGM